MRCRGMDEYQQDHRLLIWPYPLYLDRSNRQSLTLPPSLCRDFALRGKLTTRNGELDWQKPPAAQYRQAEGFVFDWGQMVERRIDNQVRWEVHLETLLSVCHERGLALSDLQQAVYHELEGLLPELTQHEPDLFDGFHLLPGSPISAFCINCHFTFEAETREWLSRTFVPLLLPGILGRLRHDLYPARR